MTAAAIGFLGVVVGLAVGFGYRFWAARRAETAHAMVASAVLAEELRALQASQTTGPSRQDERVQAAWREGPALADTPHEPRGHRHRRTVHLTPAG